MSALFAINTPFIKPMLNEGFERPLADRMRPQSLGDVVGQEHLLGAGRVLAGILKSGSVPNMIFYGPSGTGKTTIANIAAQNSKKRFYKLNATTAALADIKAIINELDGFMGEKGALLYLDEIQNFNKKQQQSLLEFIESGRITLIASTTENPYFYIYNAILSRATIFEFLPVAAGEIKKMLARAVEVLKGGGQKVRLLDDAAEHMAESAGGDVRKAINALEVAALAAPPNKSGEVVINLAAAEESTQKKAMRYDRDSHYDILSAFQKSIRGSDADAAVHYLARLVEAGDLPSICRRLMVIAAEDVGLAYPLAMSVVKSCVDAALQIGFPEARIPLAQAVLLLARAPKSNSVVKAIDAALADIKKGQIGSVPAHLRDAHYSGAKKLGRGKGYKYPHDYKNNYVAEQYLPDELVGAEYYVFGDNKIEKLSEEYWDKVKKGAKPR